MGTVGTILNVANVGMNAMQGVQNAQQKQLEAKLAADSLDAQAARKDLEAEEVLKIGELNQMEKVLEGKKDIAGQRAAFGASGVKVDSGSTLDVAADKAAWNEYDRQKIEYQSNLQSWGLRYDAALLRQEAANTRAAGSSGAGIGQAIISGSNSLVSAASSLKK